MKFYCEAKRVLYQGEVYEVYKWFDVRYMAYDSSGAVYAYRFKPRVDMYGWICARGECIMAYRAEGKLRSGDGWEDTLQKVKEV